MLFLSPVFLLAANATNAPFCLKSSSIKKETAHMTDFTSAPSFEEVTSFVKETFDALRGPYMQWANIARRAVQGLPYDAQRLAQLERYINDVRAELRRVVVVASEHFSEEQLVLLRDEARMSKNAWRSLKKNCAVTIKNGFALVSY